MICPHCKTEHPPGNPVCGAMIRLKVVPPSGKSGTEPEQQPDLSHARPEQPPGNSHGSLRIRVEGTEIRLQVGNRYKYKPAFKAEVRTSHGVLLADCVCSVEETAVKSAMEAALAVWRGPQWEER